VPLPPRVEPDGGPVEVADRVWVVRSDSLGGNVTVVAGSAGLAVVDAFGSAAAGHQLLATVRRLGRGDPVAVVLTHGHVGHTGGVAGLVGSSATPVVVHEAAAATLSPPGGEVADLRTLSSATAVDLGDRVVEVVHPGRGHSDGDVVVVVPDADVVVVGDLVRGDGPPSYGAGCWPLEWPGSLDLALQLVRGSAVVVPGHGPLLDRAAVEQQRDGIATVAEAVRELAGRMVPEDLALSQGEAEGVWPWPAERLAEAVRRGYAQLPRSAKRLPLV